MRGLTDALKLKSGSFIQSVSVPELKSGLLSVGKRPSREVKAP